MKKLECSPYFFQQDLALAEGHDAHQVRDGALSDFYPIPETSPESILFEFEDTDTTDTELSNVSAEPYDKAQDCDEYKYGNQVPSNS